MLRRSGKAPAAALRWLALVVALGGACSTSKDPESSFGGAGGQGGNGGFGNPDGGGQLFDNDGGVCAPDDDTCIDETTQSEPDGGHRDGGPVAHGDSGEPDPNDRDAESPDAEAPDADVTDPDEDSGDPTAATYKIDLLFVVDNSNSMREEQAALREQFPMLISRLLANTAIGGGEDVVPGAQDIHLGVVSTDLGAVGVPGIEGCVGLGDDGLLNDTASAEILGCSAATYEPPFLSYVAGSGDVAQLATDLSCISTLGIDGCGFEQQLESMLKAVWPGDDDRIRFLPDPNGFGERGQSGDGYPNGDFVRHGSDDVSVLALVLVTDEEDCSSSSTTHLLPQLPAGDPRAMQGLNTRCYFEGLSPEPNGLYDVNRYVDGLRDLRPGFEERVVFGAIVGVPPALVTEAVVSAVDFSDASERNAHYDTIMDHPSMQQVVDNRGTPDGADDNMLTSCTTAAGGNAYPPRRIVEVARSFGAHGFVQSICDSDWSYAMELLAQRIAQARSE